MLLLLQAVMADTADAGFSCYLWLLCQDSGCENQAAVGSAATIADAKRQWLSRGCLSLQSAQRVAGRCG